MSIIGKKKPRFRLKKEKQQNNTKERIKKLIVVYSSNWILCNNKKDSYGVSLVAQWLRICLPIQGTWVRALAREDPTCRRATKSVCHNYWAWALEPTSHNYWAHVPQLLKPAHLEPMLHSKKSHGNRSPRTAMKSSPSSPQLEKARAQQWRPNAVKSKYIK